MRDIFTVCILSDLFNSPALGSFMVMPMAMMQDGAKMEDIQQVK